MIVSHQAPEQAARLAQAVNAEHGVAAEDVVIVDTSSFAPDRHDAEATWGSGWLTLPNPGYGASANAGVRALPAGVDTVVLISPDVDLRPGTVQGLAAELAASPGVGLVGPALADARDGSVWSHGGAIVGRGREPHHLRPERRLPGPPRWLDAAVLGLRRADFEALGGFDESFFLYYEDVDLGMRVGSDLGKQVACRTDLVAAKVPDDHLTHYLDTRNRIWLLRKHREWVALGLMLAETLARLGLGAIVSPRGAGTRIRDRARALRDGLSGSMGAPVRR